MICIFRITGSLDIGLLHEQNVDLIFLLFKETAGNTHWHNLLAGADFVVGLGAHQVVLHWRISNGRAFALSTIFGH